jgi:multidrug efflux pump subunit AcrA (membrane-fusion protein)
VVVELKVKHDATVKKGDVLAVLENPDLEVELTDVRGKQQTLSAQSTQYGKRLLQLGFASTPDERSEKSRLTSDKMQIDQQLLSLETQEKILKRKRESLEIKSPIAGKVISWDLQERLMGRPVSKGEMLMTIADPTKDWELELQMLDKKMGHLSDAKRVAKANKKDLQVTYRLASEPNADRHGVVSEIRTVASPHEQEGHAVVVLVDIDENDPDHPLVEPHPGTTVTAKVDCGKRALGYVVFYQVWEWLQVNVFFHL